MTEDNDELDFGWVDGGGADEPAAEPEPEPDAAESDPGEPAHRVRAAPATTRRRHPLAATSGNGRPPEHGRRAPSRTRIRVRRAIALAALALAAFVVWFAVELFQPFAGSGSGRRVLFTVHSGDSMDTVGSHLARAGIVSSSFFFDLRATLAGDRGKLQPGVFPMRHGMSYAAALSTITSPPPETKVTVPEGYTRAQIAALAHADGLRGSYTAAATPAAAHFDAQSYGAPRGLDTLEGFLYPDTYLEPIDASASQLVAQQLASFRANFDRLSFARARAAHLSRWDVLIIASMIEREAALPGDRPLVSAVIYNRLRDGIPLGVDATLRYYLHDFSSPLTVSQLALNTPYNTRLYKGLPPTPIANPGMPSLQAAAAPAKVPYLYYVDKPYTCGKLAFATTYSQFQADVSAYDTALQKNHGRAPTRCP